MMLQLYVGVLCLLAGIGIFGLAVRDHWRDWVWPTLGTLLVTVGLLNILRVLLA